MKLLSKVLRMLFLLIIAIWFGALPVLADGPPEHHGKEGLFYAPPPDDLSAAATAPTINMTRDRVPFFAGTGTYSLIALESNGQIDPSTEDWTNEEKNTAWQNLTEGAQWWEARYNETFPLHPGGLQFVFEDHIHNPLATKYEPIIHDGPAFQGNWIQEALDQVGVPADTDYYRRVRTYNEMLRVAHGTDWAITLFIVDSSADANGQFADEYFGYIYGNIPFVVMTYTNDGWGIENLDATAAHETGHAGGALDQYQGSSPCTEKGGYLQVENQNSMTHPIGQLCKSDIYSIMRAGDIPYNNGLVDLYAKGQIGWLDENSNGWPDVVDVGVSMKGMGGNVISVDLTPYPSKTNKIRNLLVNKITKIEYSTNLGATWNTVPCLDGFCNLYSELVNIVGYNGLRVTDNFGQTHLILLNKSTYLPLIVK